MRLPPHLEERTTRLGPPARPDGELVVYWMRAAVRGHENPALDVAITLSNALARPLLVYHAISERYPYASDRHHTFLLEGAIDVAAELRARGVPYALHVERPGHRGPHLRALGDRAVVVVTEDMPVDPLRAWSRRLAERAPVWLVDAACVVPMPLVGRAWPRAHAYREATRGLRAGRLDRPWTELALEAPGRREVALPFAPVDPATMDVAALVASCEIDHAVGPVPHTRGGARAGYARWARFRQRGLRAYAARRNDAADPWGVSRMSAYLHMGFVSPLRIAREVASTPGKGAEKLLEELLVWRELAWSWCRHTAAHDTAAALPGWARETLRRHQADPRPALHDPETLERARTGDPLWDAAQRSLRVHGELHNNVRMTWGKALLGWTPDAETALARLVDLNHRYALDGRDPASYGGILWCLGAFDRPFRPAQPIVGEVRARPLDAHARRLDLAAYTAHTARPLRDPAPRTAVIGGGIAGLACARALADHGYPVTVFDKGRGPGGRLSTRRHGDDRYDHGAPSFTARDPRFARVVAAWAARGLVARWEARFATVDRDGWRPYTPRDPRWVGVPTMSAVVRHLAADLDVRWGARVGAVEHDGAWLLHDVDGEALGAFDAVVVAMPSPQAPPVLAACPALAAAAAAVEVAPCWAVMIRCAAPAPTPWDAARVRDGALGWVARESSKPGRAPGPRWVAHATPAWSLAHLEDEPADVARTLGEAFAACTGATPAEVVAHRWRYARVTAPGGPGWDPRGLAVCGDGAAGGRVEHAFLSGHAAAGRLLGHFAATRPSPRAAQLSLFSGDLTGETDPRSPWSDTSR